MERKRVSQTMRILRHTRRQTLDPTRLHVFCGNAIATPRPLPPRRLHQYRHARFISVCRPTSDVAVVRRQRPTPRRIQRNKFDSEKRLSVWRG